MSYSDLLHWLNGGGSYAAGVALYKKHSDDHTWLSLFQSAETSVTRTTLREELQKLYDVAKAADTSPSDKTPARIEKVQENFEPVHPADANRINPATLPSELRPEWETMKDLLKKQTALHNRLPLFRTNAKRLDAALEILNLDEAIAAKWKNFRAWKETGKINLPEAGKKASDSENPFELMDALNALNVRINRAKKEKAAAAHIAQLQEERTELRKKITDVRKSFQTTQAGEN